MKVYVELDIQEIRGLPADILLGATDEELKEWLWVHRKSEMMANMKVFRHQIHEEVSSRLQARVDSSSRLSLLDTISKVQRQYLQMEPPKVVFGCLLDGLLNLMKSEYGFIGEVKYETDHTVYLQTHAITNIAWDAATRKFYEENAESGLKFYNMKSLFGKVITTCEPVISNNPKTDPRRCGIPEGHPALNHFLGIPFFDHGGQKIVGMVGIANKPGGYSQFDVEFLEPFVVTCSNLIQAYNAIRENKHLINTLEEKVAERTRELKLVNENLERANRRVLQASALQLRHFACMSHEIRTPLNCIIGLSSLLRDTDLTDMQRESLRMIINSGELLCTVVNDVLDFSKLQSGNVAIDVRQTSLQETLDSVIHAIECKAQDKKLDFRTRFDAHLPELFDTDGRRLSQVLFNLLGNAIKFSNEGSLVEFTVEMYPSRDQCPPKENGYSHTFEHQLSADGEAMDIKGETPCPFHRVSQNTSDVPDHATSCVKGGEFVRFIVKDYGQGIDKKDFDRIFEPFQQASVATERVYGGTGLGLAITYRLVHTLGGTISVDSELGKFSEFTVDIPSNGAHANIDRIREGLANAHILQVNNASRERFDRKVLDTYGVQLNEFKNCIDLEAWVAREGNSPESFHFCLIQEDLFQADVCERIRCKSPKNALLTFGPKFSIKQVQRHYRSLNQILPSVLMQSMLSCMQEVSNPSADVPGEPEADPIPYSDIQVLIAEDNVINQKVLDRMLKRIGVKHVDIVDNGQKAVDRCLEKSYDIVFMDMQMPVMDGIDACRIIVDRRQDSLTPKVVFVTAHVSNNFEASAMEAGGDGFISKPYNLDMIENFFQSIHRSRSCSI